MADIMNNEVMEHAVDTTEATVDVPVQNGNGSKIGAGTILAAVFGTVAVIGATTAATCKIMRTKHECSSKAEPKKGLFDRFRKEKSEKDSDKEENGNKAE